MKNRSVFQKGLNQAANKVNTSKRHAIEKHESEKNFTKHAVLTHKKNLQGSPMRGGIRL